MAGKCGDNRDIRPPLALILIKRMVRSKRRSGDYGRKQGDVMRKTVLAFALMPSAALAQNTSSNCYMLGTTWHCDANTTPAPSGSGINIDWGRLGTAPDPNAFAKGYLLGEQMRRAREARHQEFEAARAQAEANSNAQAQAEQERQRAEVSQNARIIVGEKLRAGHCDEAVALALQYGEIELATQAKAFCSAPVPRR